MDHDQRIKTLLKEFFPEFLEEFLPEWAVRLDARQAEWLEQEAFLDPPQGERRQLDLVARVPGREPIPSIRPGADDACLALIHVEIDSSTSAAALRNRMLDYYQTLRRRHGVPVLPVALFLNVGLDGLGWDTYEERLFDRVVLHFEYAYIGLPRLDAEPHVLTGNLLGAALSALMKVPEDRQAEFKFAVLDRIARSPENDARRYLLAECLEAYFSMTPPQSARYDELTSTSTGREVKQMAVGWIERGIQQGQLDQARKSLLRQLRKKFGPVPAAVVAKIEALPLETLDELALFVLDAQSLEAMGLGDGPAP